MEPKINFEDVMKERFAQLPPSVQNAITSADVEAHLRELADHQQLHLDQWNLLENEVMLTLLGLAKTSELKQNIVKEVGVSDDVAAILAADIAEYVFKPVRDELERQLDHPAAQAAQVSDMDAMRTEQLLSNTNTPAVPATDSTTSPSNSGQVTTTASTLQPATPPAPPLTEKAVRAPAPTLYQPKVPSHERKTIEGDPYREQIS